MPPRKRKAEEMERRCWLVKSEPSDYSITAMEKEGTTVWDGVRNVVARRNLREMSLGDQVLFCV